MANYFLWFNIICLVYLFTPNNEGDYRYMCGWPVTIIITHHKHYYGWSMTIIITVRVDKLMLSPFFYDKLFLVVRYHLCGVLFYP